MPGAWLFICITVGDYFWPVLPLSRSRFTNRAPNFGPNLIDSGSVQTVAALSSHRLSFWSGLPLHSRFPFSFVPFFALLAFIQGFSLCPLAEANSLCWQNYLSDVPVCSLLVCWEMLGWQDLRWRPHATQLEKNLVRSTFFSIVCFWMLSCILFKRETSSSMGLTAKLCSLTSETFL